MLMNVAARENRLPDGAKLGKYKIVEHLGRGGFGITYSGKGEDLSLIHI